MSAQETVTVNKGLHVAKFSGSITDPDKKGADGKALVLATFVYPRIVFPWSRTGKDHEGKDVTGSVPSVAEAIAYAQSLGYSVEFELNKDGEPLKMSVVQAICDGINATEARNSRAKAENTPDSAIQKSIASFAKALGISLEAAEKQLFPNGRPF